MATTLKEMLAAANAAVPTIEPAQARSMVENDQAVLLDVRDAAEVQQSGKLKGALHVARGLLEFRADPESPSHVAALQADRPVIVYCAAGGRAALAGKTLKEMGYRSVYNLGGFKAAAEAGLETEPA